MMELNQCCYVLHIKKKIFFFADQEIFVSAIEGQTVSLTEALFPGQSSSLPQNRLLNMTYDCTTKQLDVHVEISTGVEVIPQILSLRNLVLSLRVTINSPSAFIAIILSANTKLFSVATFVAVKYDFATKNIAVKGTPTDGSSINVQNVLQAVSATSLKVPSALSTLSEVMFLGKEENGVMTVAVKGQSGPHVAAIVIQTSATKSATKSAVALIADIRNFNLASFVNTALSIDISSVPLFGTLTIPHLGYSAATGEITSSLLPQLYVTGSPLEEFGTSLPSGVSASFSVSLGDVKGIIADFTEGELDLQVPESADLSLSKVSQLIPGMQSVISSLPQTLQDIASTRLSKLYFKPSTKKLTLVGSLDSLSIIPDFLSMRNVALKFSETIGKNAKVSLVSFKGDWVINSLALTTEVVYDNNILLINASPAEDKSLNIKEFIKGLTGTELAIPSVLNVMKLTQVIGKVQDGTLSIVFIGESDTNAKVGIVYERSANNTIVAFAADVEEFQLSDIVKAGTEIDISNVPFFGKLTIPALSFVISSKQFSTANLPDLTVPGVHVPKELLLESIPDGVKGQFIADIGSAVGVNADFSDNILTIEVPSSVSFSLQGLLSVIPEVKSTIDSLPSTVKDILNAKITKLMFKPATKDLFVSLYLETLTLVPNMISLKEIKISLDTSMTSSQLLAQQLQRVSMQRIPYGYYENTAVSLPTEDAVLQAVSVNKLELEGKWVIRGLEISTTVKYDKRSKQLIIEGVANGGNGLSITDIIKAFSNADLTVPSVISSLKLNKVEAVSSDKVTTIVLTATAGKASVYLLFQKTPVGFATAIAADIQEFKLVDLIKTAMGIDLTGVPFIGSVVINSMAFTASTNLIYTPLLPTTFDSESPLQAYGNILPIGLTAYFNVQIGGSFGIEVRYADKLLDFAISSKVDLSLSNLLSEIPSISSVVKALPSPISDLLASKLEAIRFVPSTKTFSIAASLDQIIIIPDILQVNNLEVSLVAILSSSNGGLQSLDFTADWRLRDIDIRIKVAYDRVAGEVLFAAIPSQGLSIQDLISALTGISVPIPSTINSVKLARIVGRKTADGFIFIFSGTIAGKAGVHLVYQRFGRDSAIAIAAGINTFTFSELIQSAVNVDIRGIPFIGTLSVPSMALISSSGDITTSLLPEVLGENSPLARYGTTLPDGFTAKFSTPIGKTKGIVGSYADKKISFTVPSNVDASLGALLAEIPGLDADSLGLPSVFGNILKIQLKSFEFDVPSRELSIGIFMNNISFYQNRLFIKEVQLKLMAKLSSPRNFSAEFSGIIAIDKTDFAIDVTRNPESRLYTLTVETPKLSLSSIATQLGASILPDDLNKVVGKIFDFTIFNAKVVYPFGAAKDHVLISGAPRIFGLKTAHFTGLAVRYKGKIKLIQKYDLGEMQIADFIKKLFKVSLHKFAILNLSVRMELLVSPVTLNGLVTVPGFGEGLSIHKGVSFNVPFSFNRKCKTDPFCAVAQSLVGGAKLRLQATVTNTKSFRLRVSIGSLKLGGGVVLENAGIEVVSDTNPSVGIVGIISLTKPAVTFEAAIRLTVEGVELEGLMSGCWENVLESSYLTVCDLRLSMTLIPTPLPLTGLEFGGRIIVGKKSCGKTIDVAGYVGWNINPIENYFYADIGPLTFQRFFDAFCLSVKLPRPLADSGFPNGIKASFSVLGKELSKVNIDIPPGYHFKGTLNILGVTAFADINIQLPTKIFVNASLSPLNIAGILKMYKSRTDKSKGPSFLADISIRTLPKLEASGYVSVFGIEREARLLISTSKYEFEIFGNYLNLYETRLLILATYSKKISSAKFVVEGWFKSDLFATISKYVRDALQKSAKEADKFVTAARNKIPEQKAKFDRAIDNLQEAKRKVNSAKKAFDSAAAKVDSTRRKLSNVCSIKRCGSKSGEYIQ